MTNTWKCITPVPIPEVDDKSTGESPLLEIILDADWDLVLDRLSCLWKEEDILEHLIVDYPPRESRLLKRNLCEFDCDGNTVLHSAVDNSAPLPRARRCREKGTVLWAVQEISLITEEDFLDLNNCLSPLLRATFLHQWLCYCSTTAPRVCWIDLRNNFEAVAAAVQTIDLIFDVFSPTHL